jgi:hypothetical protein
MNVLIMQSSPLPVIRPLQAKIIFSVSYSQTPLRFSNFIPTKKKKQEISQFRIFQLLHFWIAQEKTKDSGEKGSGIAWA